VNVRLAPDITLLKDFKTIGVLKPDISYQLSEFKIINKTPYIFVYENITRQGAVEVWQVAEQGLKKLQSLKNVQGIAFGKNKLMITDLLAVPTELTIYQNTIYNMAATAPFEQGEVVDLANQLGKKNILGSVLATRCTFDPKDNIACLVKQRKVGQDNYKFKDSLVKYESATKKIETIYDNVSFSASRVFVSTDSQFYIIGQENRNIYKLKS
jgi:hypothetical protein